MERRRKADTGYKSAYLVDTSDDIQKPGATKSNLISY
ncbi:hypothetical protein CCACVL1_07522 [Corchorus capsularis]|uniref:Uncharacterized protein n=1 Tax=Corchorus capsularis TaxID=210143 RepID=A0A1R3J5G3_COCAP|nr:hypothetical protein CCACVL1_07522 [Corchorus capsularis]